MKRVAPYGTWDSPLTAARVTAGKLRFDYLVLDGNDLYWVEGRASEGGRYVIVRRTPDGRISDVTPAGFNVRTRVHEYGGAAYAVHNGTVYFSNFVDQRIYRQVSGAEPVPLTVGGYFYADCRVDPIRGRLICVREDHTNGRVEPVNAIVSVPLEGGGDRVVVSGADFYSDPVLSPDGLRLAWLQWNHPNMPWDGTELWVADATPEGNVDAPRRVAGGRNESLFQPDWSPQGQLYFVSDQTGWWNLYRTDPAGPTNGEIHAVHEMTAEFGKPQWTFSQSTYAFIDASRLVVTYSQEGRWSAALVDVASGEFAPLDWPVQALESIRATSRELFFIGGSPVMSPSIVRARIPEGEADAPSRAIGPATIDVIRSSRSERVDSLWISVAEGITFSSDRQKVHAFYYPPKNPEREAPRDERPPLLVLSHGGPTGATSDVLDEEVQFWTSRGFAVLDVNYSGSTGYGRGYRDRLKGQWGIADVADCVNGARHLVADGKADPSRLIIRGGSAGGYTTLAALTFHDTFRAGASYYGISDIEVLARDTHKFESRYLDSLVGPYPEARDLYRQRSPIHFTDRLSCALILFQGLEDKVVPPNQSEMMADAVRHKGLPVAYVPFPGEQHGFRKAENIVRSLEAELFFYGAVFGFAPADSIEPVAIDNLR